MVDNWFLTFRCEVKTLFQGHLIKFISCCSLGLLSDNHSVLSCMSPGSLTSVETLPRPSSGSTRTVPTITHTNKIRNIYVVAWFSNFFFLIHKLPNEWDVVNKNQMICQHGIHSDYNEKCWNFLKTSKYVYIYCSYKREFYFHLACNFLYVQIILFLLSITSIIRNFSHLQFAAIQNNLTIYSSNNWALYLFFHKLKKRIFVTNKIISKVKIKALCDILHKFLPISFSLE